MDISTNRKVSSGLLQWRPLGASSALSLAFALLALALPAPSRSQEPPPTPEEIAKAAREARAHKAASTEHQKIITNEELVVRSPQPSASPASPDSPDSPPEKVAEVPKPKATGCDSANAERLKAELQSAQDEFDQIQRQLSSNPEVISGGNVDLKNFKPGSTGVSMGTPALLETKAPSPAQVQKVTLEEKVASLKKAVKIACDSPEDAETQAKLDLAELELNTLQRQIEIDQYAYYSKTNYAADTAGKAQLDAELAQKQSLQDQIEHLKSELAAPKPN